MPFLSLIIAENLHIRWRLLERSCVYRVLVAEILVSLVLIHICLVSCVLVGFGQHVVDHLNTFAWVVFGR
jgi:hypothetical protein